MKDFTFTGGDFLTYAQTCAKIKEFGVFPEMNPPEHIIQRVQEIITRCMVHYRPAPGELQLCGVYVYREEEQAGDLRQTFGVAYDVGHGQALIGLSFGLLQYNMPVYFDIIFLHECSHLHVMEHNEEFENRFNELEFDYFFYNNLHTDGRGTQRKPLRKGWKM